MKKSKEKTYNMFQNCAFMIGRAWRELKSVLWVCLGIIACGVADSLLELFVVPAVLEAVERGASPGEFLRMILWFALGIALVRGLWHYLGQNTLFGRVQLRVGMLMEMHLAFCRTSFPHTEDPDYLDRQEKAARCLQSNHEAGEIIWTTLTDLLTSAISFVIYLLLLAQVGPWVALLCAVLAAVSYFAGEYIRSWQHRHRKEEGEVFHKLHYLVQRGRDTKLAKDIRIFGLAPWLNELFGQYGRIYQDFYEKAAWHYLLGNLVVLALAVLRNAVAYGMLIAMALRGELTAAEFVLYFTAVSGFANQVSGIFSGLSALRQNSLDISAMREFLDIPEIFRFEDGKPLPVKPDHLYELELRDVSFRYPGADHDTLSHVSLTIHPGEKLAVVGRNGAGKTTLIKLLCGFYDPTEGQVLLDGEDIRQYDRRDYYKHFSAVFQQFSLLAATMAENVAQTDDIDRPRMWDCLERAGVAEKIRSLPREEDTMLGRDVYLDGVELSGGQTQRLMLARALYKNAPVVVLDEPTAALDPIAESDLYQKYSDLTGSCTSVYISHRLASTRFCDRVLLIENGGIAEEGTHEELLEKGGRYAYLFNVQSKYYKKGAMEDE